MLQTSSSDLLIVLLGVQPCKIDAYNNSKKEKIGNNKRIECLS